MKKKILVIDDMGGFTTTLRLMYRDDPDLELITTNSIQEALPYLEGVEVIFLDTDLAEGEKGPNFVDRFVGYNIVGMSSRDENRIMWEEVITRGSVKEFINKTKIVQYINSYYKPKS